MDIKQLKNLLARWEERLAQEQTPEILRETLVSEFGKNPPTKIVDLFGSYQSAYNNLAHQYKKLRELISDAEANNLTEIPDEEIPNLDNFLAEQYNFYTLSSNLRIEQNLAYRHNHANKIILETPKAEEKIVLTTSDFSDDFLAKFTEPVNTLCKIFSGPFDFDSVNSKLKAERHLTLFPNLINEGFDKDFARQLCALNTQPGVHEADSPEGKQKTKTALNNFVNQALTSLKDKFKLPGKMNTDTMEKGLTGLVSTLGAQSALLNAVVLAIANSITLTYNNVLDEDRQAHTGIISFLPLDNKVELKQSRIFFNQEKNKLQVEVLLTEKEPSLSGTLLANEKLTNKITFDIDIKVDAQGNPVFNMENFNVALIITKSYEEQKKGVQIVIEESALKLTENTNPKYIDNLRSHLEDIVKFAGQHNTLVSFLYEAPYNNDQTIKTQQEKAERNSKNQRFDNLFINKLTTDPKERDFLTQLYHHDYIDHLGKKSLVKDILTFFAEQFPKIPYSDKTRYIYLLKIAKNLGATPKEINSVLAKALDESFKQEGGLNKSERLGITLLYKDLYTSISQQEVIVTPGQVNERIKALAKKEFENSDKNINKDRYIFSINRAIEYKIISFEEGVKKLNSSFGPQETVDILCRRYNSQDSLFEAAKVDQTIYQELVNPKKNWHYYWQNFKESLPTWLGGIEKKPKFTLEQNLELLAKHADLIKDNPTDPYTQLRERCRAELNQSGNSAKYSSVENKLKFLMEHTEDISQESENEMTTKLDNIGETFLTGLSNYLKTDLAENQAKSGYNSTTEFDRFIKDNNPLLLQSLQERPETREAFLAYANQGDASPESVKGRLYKIIRNNDAHPKEIDKNHLEQRFGQNFINKLTQDINQLSSNPITQASEVNTICSLFEKNSWLSQAIGLTSESQEFITMQLARIKEAENAAQKTTILPGQPETTSEKPVESVDNTSAKFFSISEKSAEPSTTPDKSSSIHEQLAHNSPPDIAAAALSFKQGPILSSSPAHTHTNEPTPKSESSSNDTPSSNYTP